ncbi:MAG: BatA domain-containing protein [Sedimentisphaerales bacterium]|nr:BatA domain-containing protein [Sedimentisphaerales bacterium]
MSFLAWTFLFGALAVAGPIVAHLLSKPRFRRVPFTMIRFLRAGQSHSHSRRRLRDLLILLLRCAIIVLIAILFAQPVLRVKTKPPVQRALFHLALDDSMSMAYRDGSRTLFDHMIEKTLNCIRQAPDDTSFHIYGLASGRSSQNLGKREALAATRRLKPVPAGVRLTDFLAALGQGSRTATTSDRLSAVILSDFTPSVLRELDQVQTLTTGDIQYEPILPARPAENTAIVAARVAGIVGDTLNLDVTVAHYGQAQRQCTLTAQILSRGPAGKQEVSLAAGQHRIVRLQLALNAQSRRSDRHCLPIELNLSPQDGLVEDDTYHLAVYMPPASPINMVLVYRDEETFLFETAMQALSSSGSLEQLHLTKVPQGRLIGAGLHETDILVFSSLAAGSTVRTGDLKTFLQKGGRLLFFTAGAQDLEPARQLSREGLLPAQPQQWVQAITRPEPTPGMAASGDLDDRAVRSLSNYRLDQVVLKGYWQCRPTAQAQRLWRLAGGEGLLYSVPCGHGLSIFINTSIDDSLGLLAKSAAWVAFCRSIVGETDEIRQFCFSIGERPVLRVRDTEARDPRRAVSVENCDGTRARAATQGNLLLLPLPAGIGWMKTTDEPALYAGVNLPAGETDLSAPTAERMEDILHRNTVSTTHPTASGSRPDSVAAAASGFRQRPAWPVCAWAAIALLVLESAVANRLKR